MAKQVRVEHYPMDRERDGCPEFWCAYQEGSEILGIGPTEQLAITNLGLKLSKAKRRLPRVPS